jgi:hypothetical protein
MERTIHATLTTDELIRFAMFKDNRTSLEIELAQRLEVALHQLSGGDQDDDLHVRYGYQ